MKRKFTEIYNEIFAKNNQNLEILRKRRINTYIFTFLSIIITWVLGLFVIKNSNDQEHVIIILFLLVFIELLIGISKANKRDEYSKAYKENVIKEIIKGVDDNLQYDYTNGISENIYRRSKLNGHYDVYSSEDYIGGVLENGIKVEMAQVKTAEWRESTDSDGHRTRTLVTTFCGLYGCIKLSEFLLTDFVICKNRKMAELNSSRIEIDSAEFEKKFDCFALDKIRTMQLLTSDIIEQFVEFSDKVLNKRGFIMHCAGNELFFSINNGDIFETATFKKAINFDELYKYYNMIDFPIKIAEELSNRAKEIG
jgi:hypothetical protein